MIVAYRVFKMVIYLFVIRKLRLGSQIECGDGWVGFRCGNETRRKAAEQLAPPIRLGQVNEIPRLFIHTLKIVGYLTLYLRFVVLWCSVFSKYAL